ncbi:MULTISPECIES: hypothetical protein [unclassified Colwellia]|uniref:hypothetical protein n=1 Tax=unclassified Colwellia TaxID=196834 RepID=UPI0015F6D64E|nr:MULTISPECIES: hypothetical protein [unclassified Colwellia]MBA6381302.1 hypothetical protein [Colwellia sp. BRX10-7]MBA6385183.1 hypothetical protein [Colwellia sp. BRX10-9]MBA6389047.1 hypothetical protein [Colwellia sp. BRX10-2]MBA6396025.1 hypothetical protein [Colwellia sp. BRX10-6]MBA6403772.1 hypothetical protein [Colwellia sp. BRX10-5]
MKKIKLLFLYFLVAMSSSCAFSPIKTEVKENHFIFENFINNNETEIEYIHLMCSKKKLAYWTEPKQFLADEYDFWVKADITKNNRVGANKVAFFHFKVNFESGKRYMPNRVLEKNKISIWIQEVGTGTRVSKIETKNLKFEIYSGNNLRKKQCRLGDF